MNLYRTLGVRKNASLKTIKDAYRALSKTYHPDVGGDGARFGEIALAYRVLKDPATREAYDRDGSMPEPESSDHQTMMEVLADLYRQYLKSGDAFKSHVDLMGSMRKSAEEALGRIRPDIEGLERSISLLEGVLPRIKHKGKRENVFEQITDAEIRGRRDKLRQLQKIERGLTLAVKELADYDSIVEIVQQTTWINMTASTASAW